MIADSVDIAVILATFGLLFFRQIRVYPLTWSITAATGAIVVIALGAISPSKTGVWGCLPEEIAMGRSESP